MKTAIHTKTKAEFIAVLAIFELKGWTWNDGDKPLKCIDIWDNCKEKTCIRFEDSFGYCNKESYEQRGYKIISFEDFMKIKDKKTCPECGHVLEEKQK